MARGVTLAGVTPGLRRLAWLIEVRGLANRSEGFGGRALSIKVKGLGGRAGPGPVDKSEGFLSIKVRGWGPGRPGPCR